MPGEERERMDGPDVETDARRIAADELEALRHDLDEEKNRRFRLLADFDNFRRRAACEQEKARQEGRKAALLPALAVFDTLERALAAGSSDEVFYEGVVATQRQLLDALREAGAEPVAAVGRAFDPRVHEAVETVASDDLRPGTIVREVRRGWRLGNELLRPAQVVVAAAPPEDDDP
jgi:molecular chaperone GrpE